METNRYREYVSQNFERQNMNYWDWIEVNLERVNYKESIRQSQLRQLITCPYCGDRIPKGRAAYDHNRQRYNCFDCSMQQEGQIVLIPGSAIQEGY